MTDTAGLQADFLVGPTASGKSSVAQLLAEESGGAVLSADAMLVYRGMDIGTAKPTAAERGAVPYYGLDLAGPDQAFNVWAYARHAREALRRCRGEGRRVIVVGGTGLYVKSLTHGLDSAPAPDEERRAEWARRLAEEGVGALQAELERRAPELLAALHDPGNPRRLVRALENAAAGRTQPRRRWAGRGDRLVGLRLAPEWLNSRIERRVRDMYRQGFVEEVRRLLAAHGRLSVTATRAIGYAEAIDLLAGRCSQEEAIDRTALRTRQLAKRQRTWFRRQADVAWVDVTEDMPIRTVAQRVAEQWRRLGAARIAEG